VTAASKERVRTGRLAVVRDLERTVWAESASESLVRVATTALGLPAEALGPAAAPTTASLGAYVPVMTPDEAIQIGIVGDAESCLRVARALLQLADGDELGDADVTDAIGEIANMVAGMTKAALAPRIGVVALGLPMVIHGWVAPRDGLELETIACRVGDATISVVVLRPRR
jgi:hypothetical protein